MSSSMPFSLHTPSPQKQWSSNSKGQLRKKSAVIRQALQLCIMVYRKFSRRTITQVNPKRESPKNQGSKTLLSTQWLSNMGYRGALIPAALWMEGDTVLVLFTKRRAQFRSCLKSQKLVAKPVLSHRITPPISLLSFSSRGVSALSIQYTLVAADAYKIYY